MSYLRFLNASHWRLLGGVNEYIPAILALVGVVAAPTLSYIAARRKSSGDPSTSEADLLWDESTKIRSELREDLKSTKIELESLRKENQDLKFQIYILQIENDSLKNKPN